MQTKLSISDAGNILWILHTPQVSKTYLLDRAPLVLENCPFTSLPLKNRMT